MVMPMHFVAPCKSFLPDMDYSRLGHILQEIKTLVAGFRKSSFSYVSKFGNYSLAKFVKSIFDDVIWIEDSPPLVIEDLFFDVNVSLLWMKIFYLKKIIIIKSH